MARPCGCCFSPEIPARRSGAVAAGAAEACPAGEEDGGGWAGSAIGSGIMGDRPAAHRLARSRAGTRRPANGEEGESMPEMGDAEQAIRRLGLSDEDVAAWHDSGLPEDISRRWHR